MAYNLGVVGMGHWFERLYVGMLKTREIRLLKVAGTRDIGLKRDRLSEYGVPESNYYRISGGMELPAAFFDGVDVVHISDPNEFHAAQTIQALSRGKVALTEKTLGVNREEFEKVLGYIEANKLEKKAYLHLHYAHKTLTLLLPELLRRLTADYGRIAGASATFFEIENPDPARRRLWVYDMKNGGIFMDWIHPFEVYYKGAMAKAFKLKEAESYIANPDYSRTNPTAAMVRVGIEGALFRPGAEAVIRVGMGLRLDGQRKRMRFVFEEGQCLDLEFINSEAEYTSGRRGSWTLAREAGGEVVESGAPAGPTTSDILVGDILELCRGSNPGFSTDDMRAIFESQWRYQDMMASREPVGGAPEVERFIQEGIGNSMP